MRQLLLFITLIIFVIGMKVQAYEVENPITLKVFEICDLLVSKIPALKASPIIAVSEFSITNENDRTISHIISDLLIDKLSTYENYVIIERLQFDKIIETINISYSGLYDENTVVALGELIGADYFIAGAIEKTATSYFVTARLISSITAEVISENKTEISIHSFENEIDKYISPSYRFSFGSFISWNIPMLFLDVSGLGLAFKYDYYLKKRHALSLNLMLPLVELFDFYLNNDSIGIEYGYNFRSYVILTFGYGYLIPVSDFLLLKPHIAAGLSTLFLETYYISQMTDNSISEIKRVFQGIFPPGVDFIFSHQSPVSIYISLSLNFPFPRTEAPLNSFEGFDVSKLNKQNLFQTIRIESGLSIYF
ncbi:hypothetical protein ES708_11166 [subsurface metagenome]